MSAKPAPPRPAPRLYLATPVTAEPALLIAALPQLLAAADVAAVLLRLEPADPRTLITRIKAVANVVQAGGAALLLDGHADLVARGGADGAHLSGLKAMQEWLTQLQPSRIAGVGGLTTRHDAMVAGEAGADYVLFGEPAADGSRPSADAVAERLDWWAELFEPPCIGYAASRQDVHQFATAGADFVLVGDFIWAANDAAAALADAAAALTQGFAAAARPAAARSSMQD